MPSKTSFALLALLAASVSALPTRGNSYNDLFARDPVTASTKAVVTPSAGAGAGDAAGASAAVQPPAQPPVVGGLSASGSGQTAPGPVAAGPVAAGSGLGHHPHPHGVHPHPHTHGVHPHPHSVHHHPGAIGHHPHPLVHRHNTHSGELSQMSSQGTVHHPHRRLSHDPSMGAINAGTPLPSSGSATTVAPPPTGSQQTLSRREFYENPEFERRGLLETLGLKARVASLTVKQTDQLSKAKTICGGLASKKDQHTCHKNVDKIIQLTKERNYDVEQFIKITNHHDVFTTSDPSLKSSSSSTSS